MFQLKKKINLQGWLKDVTQFYRIFKEKESFVLSNISKGKVANLKNLGCFFKKMYILNPPFLDFSEIGIDQQSLVML